MRYEIGTTLFLISDGLAPVRCTVQEDLGEFDPRGKKLTVKKEGSDELTDASRDELYYGEENAQRAFRLNAIMAAIRAADVRNQPEWQIGDIVWLQPIRYWEEQEPERNTIVLNDGGEYPSISDLHLYTFHDGYGHNVYISRPRSFRSKTLAIRHAKIEAALDELRLDAGTDYLMDRTLTKTPEELSKLILPPSSI